MRAELVDLLAAYLSGWKTLRDCAEWLAGINWDDPKFDPRDRNLAGRLELLVTEVAEGLRPVADFDEEAATIVARNTTSLFVTLRTPWSFPPSVGKVCDSADSLLRTPEFIVTSGGRAQLDKANTDAGTGFQAQGFTVIFKAASRSSSKSPQPAPA